ncbi:MAG TPA: hypothetical protein VEW67_03950 [Thermoleophilaceae bacterium]|nr:hypothetical protein [Thermoleophilaceae bacterium]
MPSQLDRRKATQRRALKKQSARRRKFHAIRVAIAKAAKNIATRRKLIRAAEAPPGQLALQAAGTMLGKTESNNRAPWLQSMIDYVVKAGGALTWMVGQPYCGLGVIWSYLKGAGLKLPDGTVYTPNILSYHGETFTAKDGRRYVLRRVAPEQAHPGAIVVMDFTPGTGADHVALARGPMRGGVIPTREFNTSPSNGGSQANGGGVYDRTRPRAFVLGVLNVVPA